MSAQHQLHRAILSALQADAGLQALLAAHTYAGSPSVAGVYDFVEQSSTPESRTPFPYVVIGDTTAAEFDTDEVSGQESTVTLHVWDRYRGGARVRQILDAIHACLHDATLAVTGQNTVFCYFEFSGSVPDPDVLTQHAVTRFRIVTQEG